LLLPLLPFCSSQTLLPHFVTCFRSQPVHMLLLLSGPKLQCSSLSSSRSSSGRSSTSQPARLLLSQLLP
jgi:hypothetical protein